MIVNGSEDAQTAMCEQLRDLMANPR